LVLLVIKSVNNLVEKIEELTAWVVRNEFELRSEKGKEPVKGEGFFLRQALDQLRNDYFIGVADLIHGAEEHTGHDEVFGGFHGTTKLHSGELFEKLGLEQDTGGPYTERIFYDLLLLDSFTT